MSREVSKDNRIIRIRNAIHRAAIVLDIMCDEIAKYEEDNQNLFQIRVRAFRLRGDLKYLISKEEMLTSDEKDIKDIIE